jgi:hypothetical protein
MAGRPLGQIRSIDQVRDTSLPTPRPNEQISRRSERETPDDVNIANDTDFDDSDDDDFGGDGGVIDYA